MATDGLPHHRAMTIRLELFDRAEPALEDYTPGSRRGRGIGHLEPDRLAGRRMRLPAGRHGHVLRSSAKNLFNSALLMTPPKLSNFPSAAIARADLTKASIATRAIVPPTLMRR